MKLKEVNRIFEIEIEIEIVLDQLYEINNRSEVKGQVISDMPKGSKGSQGTIELVIQKETLEEKLKVLNEQRTSLRTDIQKLIDKTNDNEMKKILDLRLLKAKTWETIGYELSISSSTANKLYHKFFKKLEKTKLREKYIDK